MTKVANKVTEVSTKVAVASLQVAKTYDKIADDAWQDAKTNFAQAGQDFKEAAKEAKETVKQTAKCASDLLQNPSTQSGDNDAVLITFNDEIPTHNSLLVQDENGQWYFFYWGPASEDVSFGNPAYNPLGTTAAPILAPIFDKDIVDNKTNTVDIDALNRYLEQNGIYHTAKNDPENKGKDFDSYVYYSGNYIGTYNYLSSYINSSHKYNLYFNNCGDVSVEALLKGSGMSSLERINLIGQAASPITFPWLVDKTALLTQGVVKNEQLAQEIAERLLDLLLN